MTIAPMSSQPKRPVLRYHGGKWRLAPWVIEHMPAHRVYTEVFGGAASVLIRKPRSYAEVYNDLNGEVVNLFRVLRDSDLSAELERLIRLTPFARDEFIEAYEHSVDPVEQARRSITKAFMGFGSGSMHDNFPRGMRTRASEWRPPTGFRGNSNRSGTTPAFDWANYPEQIQLFCERLQCVVIENRPAIEVLATHDRTDALHYVDPPYVHTTRNIRRKTGTGVYSHELTDEDHRALAEKLHALKGMVLLSGYPCPLYEELYGDWERVEKRTMADGAKERTEVLWMNPAVSATRQDEQVTLEVM